MATHSNILDWRIPWTEEPSGLQSMRSQRVGQYQLVCVCVCVYVCVCVCVYIHQFCIISSSNHFESPVANRRNLFYEENRILSISQKKLSKMIMETEEPIKNMKRRLTALKEPSDCLRFIYLAHPQGQGIFIAFQILLNRTFGATGQMKPKQCQKWKINIKEIVET